MLFELLEARKRQIAQQYHYARRLALKSKEPFDISHCEWMSVWQRQPDPTEPGRIIKANTAKPWSVRNALFDQCADMGQPVMIYEGVRTLSVTEWVRELKRKR